MKNKNIASRYVKGYTYNIIIIEVIKVIEKRQAKLIVNKSGSGSLTTRATLPISWIKKMGLDENSRDLSLEFDGEKIIIKKLKK